MKIDDVLKHDDDFKKALLYRMETDCLYYLGNGNRYDKHLWAGNVADHIAYMTAIYTSFESQNAPAWIDLEKINKYLTWMTMTEKEMRSTFRKIGKESVWFAASHKDKLRTVYEKDGKYFIGEAGEIMEVKKGIGGFYTVSM